MPRKTAKRAAKPKRQLHGAALQSHLNKTCAAPPAPKGNQRAAKHGASSEVALRPLREEHLKALRRDYPQMDDRRLAILADRLARIDLATAWIDERGSLVRNKLGQLPEIVRDLERWSARAEQVLAEAEKEARKPLRADLALEMAALDDA